MSKITVDNVTYRYGKHKPTVLSGINCSFECGKMYAILGKSGCGKTTFLSLLGGLFFPLSGNIYIDGKKLTKDWIEYYRYNMVSFIFQDFRLFSHLNVLENLKYLMELKGLTEKEAISNSENLLTEMGIQPILFKQFPEKLSGGEQQRVALARAIAWGGSIILADEPTGNLDSENCDNIATKLRNLVETQNACVIIVTHDSNLASKCDFIYEMCDGKILLK